VNDFTKPYDTDNTIISKLVSRRYYIAAGTKGNSLFMSESDDTTDPDYSVELVEGVDDMQILYGVDSSGDGNPNAYYSSGHANLDIHSEWQDVVSVRITLTFRVIDRDFSDTVIPTRSVSTTVLIRNSN
jgi:type IV pilus assembly protein PilW